MKVHSSALKHGVRPEDAGPGRDFGAVDRELDEESPARQMQLGFDTQGRLAETVVLVFDSGNKLMIHAMKSRPQMRGRLP